MRTCENVTSKKTIFSFIILHSLICLTRRDIGEEVTALAWDGDQAIVGGGRGSIQVNKDGDLTIVGGGRGSIQVNKD